MPTRVTAELFGKDALFAPPPSSANFRLTQCAAGPLQSGGTCQMPVTQHTNGHLAFPRRGGYLACVQPRSSSPATAKRQLAATTAGIGLARKDLYPFILLSGPLGRTWAPSRRAKAVRAELPPWRSPDRNAVRPGTIRLGFRASEAPT